jgi:DNA-directed RNA polymerases I, II, and III subunit RPABC1
MISSQKLFASRKVILEMLKKRGFNIETYTNYTIVEIETMRQHSVLQSKTTSEVQPLDILTEPDSNGNKALIKYIFTSKIKVSSIGSLLIELKESEILKEGDSFILITKDRNIGKAAGQDTIVESQLEALYNEHKVFVQMFWIDKLITNIMEHEIVPEHNIISTEEKEKLLDQFNISTYNQLPLILKTDPVAMFLGMRRGDVCKIISPSETSGEYISYRYCQ